MYLLAASTGYRRGEIGSLKLRSFVLGGDPPTVTVQATYSKHRKKDTQVLPVEVAEHLKKWIERKNPSTDEILFPVSEAGCGVDRRTSEMVQRDLAAAQAAWLSETDDPEELERRQKSDFLVYRDKEGRFADFHATRHTFITNLSRAGVSPKTAQKLARHSDIRLTMNVYSHTDLAEKVEAVGRLPSAVPSVNGGLASHSH